MRRVGRGAVRLVGLALLLGAVAAPALAGTHILTVGKLYAKWDDIGGATISAYHYAANRVVVLPSGATAVRFRANWTARNTSWWWSRKFYFKIRVREVFEGAQPYYGATYTKKTYASLKGGTMTGTVTSDTFSLGSRNFKVFRVEILVDIYGKKNSGWKAGGYPVFRYPKRAVRSVDRYEGAGWIYAAYCRKWAYASLRSAQDELSSGWGNASALWLAFLKAYAGSLDATEPSSLGHWSFETLTSVFDAFIDVYRLWILQLAWNYAQPQQSRVKSDTLSLKNRCGDEQYDLERLFYSSDSIATRKSQLKQALNSQKALLNGLGSFGYSGTSFWGGGELKDVYTKTLDLYLNWWSTYRTKATDSAMARFRRFLRDHSTIFARDKTWVADRISAATYRL